MQLEIYEAKHLVIDHSVTTRPRVVNAYEFDLFNSAYRNIYIDNTLYMADENCAVCRKPGQIVHSVGHYDNLILTLRLVDGDNTENTLITHEFLQHIPTLFYPTHINELKQIVSKIITLYHYNKNGRYLKQELCRFLLLLLSDSFEQTPSHVQKQPSRIYKITSYIEQHYAKKTEH